MLLDQDPIACPFVALESDRDRRAETPDSRHRCYAEPVPAPRALSHQKAFCLSPDFPGCPIFKDWAVRAAATPLAIPAGGRRSEPEQIELLPTAVVADATPAPEDSIPVMAADEPDEPPAGDSNAADDLQPAFAEDADAPLPAFLASRAEQLPSLPARPRTQPVAPIASEFGAADQPPVERHPVGREELIPSWERDPAFATPRDNRLAALLSRATAILLVLALLALAGMAIVLAPGLLGGGQPTQPAAAASPSPTTGVESSPTDALEPSAVPSIEPTAGTAGSYTIKSGDNLCTVSRRLGVSYEQLVGANPQITNPNRIRIGQVLSVPAADFVPPTPAPDATPVVSPCG